MKKISQLLLVIFALFSGGMLLNGQSSFDQLIIQEGKSGKQKLKLAHEKSLTNNYDLKYHRLEWQVEPQSAFINGRVTSVFEVGAEAIFQIVFDLSNAMQVSSVEFEGEELGFEQDEYYLFIDFNAELNAGSLHEIVVIYSGAPGVSGEGNLVSTTHNGVPILWTFAEPFGAREWWPCKQSLDDKIDSIDVFVTVPIGLKVASNGLLMSVVPNEGFETHHWKHRFPIPAYLIAFAVTNYEEFTVTVPHEDGDVDILNYVYPENLETYQEKEEEMIFIMSLLNEYFGLYPFQEEKYGHAEWGRGGGMEHSTMSFMTGLSNGLMTHELAHQWFGDQVTCGSWEDIWLNEGFASYCTALYYERKWVLDNDYPYWDGWKSQIVDFITSEPDGSVWVDDVTDSDRIFNGRLSYRKGAYLLHMLRWEMGDEEFFHAIRNYLGDPNLAFSYVRTEDLISHLESVHEESLNEFFEDWFYGQGYPSHSIRYQFVGENLYVKVNQSQSHASVSFFELTIPLVLRGDGQTKTFRLKLEYDGQFFVVPVSEAELGFSVQEVVYDPELWLISNENVVEETLELFDVDLVLNLYPNPVQEILSFNLNRPLSSPYDVYIYDITGKIVFFQKGTKEQAFKIDVSALAPGNYQLHVINEAEDVKHSFIVERR